MKEERERPVALGPGVTKPDILAEVERGEQEEVAGCYREHRSPPPHTTPAGSSQGDWLVKEVKSEEGASPPPGSPQSHHAVPPRERGCSYCGLAEPEPSPGAGNGGFVTPSPAFKSHLRHVAEPPLLECAECGRGVGHKPDLVRHRLACGGERAHACGHCGRSFAEPAGLGSAGSPRRPSPCTTGRCPGSAEQGVPAAAPRKERKELSLTEKVRVLEMLEGPKVSQSELAKRFGVSQPQICRIIKNKERILGEWRRHGHPDRKRRRDGKDAALEAALLRWVEGARTADLPGAGPLLRLDTKHLAESLGQPDTEPAGGWPARIEARRDVALEKPPAEQGDAEQPAAELRAGAVLPGILRGYAPAEIYACGETGVLLPGGSASERLTLLLCANADGSEKVPLRVVGESPRPRCLRGVNLGHMPWSYRAGGLAAVTAPLFAEWLQEFDEGMRRRGKSVLLLLAEHEAHPYLQLSNVRMVFVPPAAALAHPLDRGIAGDLKAHYRRRLLRWLPAGRGAARPTLLDVLHMLAQAWGDVCPALIAGCFRAAGLSPDAGTDTLALAAAPGPRLERDGELADADGDAAEDEGEPAAAQPCPSEREARASLATLRRYLECRATAPGVFRAFYELEDAVHAAAAGAGDLSPKQ